MSLKARYYREQVARFRELAEQADGDRLKDNLLSVANEYDRLALEEAQKDQG